MVSVQLSLSNRFLRRLKRRGTTLSLQQWHKDDDEWICHKLYKVYEECSDQFDLALVSYLDEVIAIVIRHFGLQYHYDYVIEQSTAIDNEMTYTYLSSENHRTIHYHRKGNAILTSSRT